MTDILSDPRLSKPLAALIDILVTAEDYNHPITSKEKVRSSGKPGSRPPGEQQSEWLVKRLEYIMRRAVKDADAALVSATPKDVRAEVVHSVGGILIEVREESGRRGPYVKRMVTRYACIAEDSC